MQDSESDRDSEIRKMEEIYKNATITIAAMIAFDVCQSFSSSRSEVDAESLPLPFLLPDPKYGFVRITPFQKDYNPQGPLIDRGWALHEFLLSPRVLYFGQSEVAWHCQSEQFEQMSSSYFGYAIAAFLVWC